jgi:hypothetical protein
LELVVALGVQQQHRLPRPTYLAHLLHLLRLLLPAAPRLCLVVVRLRLRHPPKTTLYLVAVLQQHQRILCSADLLLRPPRRPRQLLRRRCLVVLLLRRPDLFLVEVLNNRLLPLFVHRPVLVAEVVECLAQRPRRPHLLLESLVVVHLLLRQSRLGHQLRTRLIRSVRRLNNNRQPRRCLAVLHKLPHPTPSVNKLLPSHKAIHLVDLASRSSSNSRNNNHLAHPRLELLVVGCLEVGLLVDLVRALLLLNLAVGWDSPWAPLLLRQGHRMASARHGDDRRIMVHENRNGMMLMLIRHW